MKHTEIKDVIKKRLEKINTTFDKARMHLHEEDLRVFRVKVKKLTACLQLINATNEHLNQIKVPRKILNAFQISGDLRMLQIQKNYIQKVLDGKQITLPGTYLALVAEKTLQQTDLLGNYLNDPTPFKKAEGKFSGFALHDISQKKLQDYIYSEGDKINGLLAPVFPSDKSFHQVRKQIKNLLYISPYVEMDFGDLFPFNLLSNYDNVASFTTILGSFHDIKTAIDFMHTACQKIEIDQNEKTALWNIETLWIKEREDIRAKIYEEIKKITISGLTAKTHVVWPVM